MEDVHRRVVELDAADRASHACDVASHELSLAAVELNLIKSRSPKAAFGAACRRAEVRESAAFGAACRRAEVRAAFGAACRRAEVRESRYVVWWIDMLRVGTRNL